MTAIMLHEDETGCTYTAFQVKPFQWFCTKCGWGEREAPPISEFGIEAVLGDDFYRCPNTGEWVYKWADERLVLRFPEGLDNGSEGTR